MPLPKTLPFFRKQHQNLIDSSLDSSQTPDTELPKTNQHFLCNSAKPANQQICDSIISLSSLVKNQMQLDSLQNTIPFNNCLSIKVSCVLLGFFLSVCFFYCEFTIQFS